MSSLSKDVTKQLSTCDDENKMHDQAKYFHMRKTLEMAL